MLEDTAMRKLLLAAIGFATAATLACGSDDEEPSSSPQATDGATLAPTSSASPSEDSAETALAAAIALLNGVPEADCATNNPEQKDCVSLDPNDRELASLGIAVLAVEGPAGGSSALIMGQDAEGEWDYYAGGQQYYQASQLPGEMLVCTQGEGLNVRAEPSADADLITTLEDNSTATGEAFVLSEAGTPPPDALGGYGWYRISAPVEGWVYSKYVSGLADCSLHDSLETP
jgi:hypothetical protein